MAIMDVKITQKINPFTWTYFAKKLKFLRRCRIILIFWSNTKLFVDLQTNINIIQSAPSIIVEKIRTCPLINENSKFYPAISN